MYYSQIALKPSLGVFNMLPALIDNKSSCFYLCSFDDILFFVVIEENI